MANHPNRSKKQNLESNPTPQEVIDLRFNYGLTQAQAAKMWMVTQSTVQKWEAAEGSVSHRRVHPLMWWAMQRIIKEKLK